MRWVVTCAMRMEGARTWFLKSPDAHSSTSEYWSDTVNDAIKYACAEDALAALMEAREHVDAGANTGPWALGVLDLETGVAW